MIWRYGTTEAIGIVPHTTTKLRERGIGCARWEKCHTWTLKVRAGEKHGDYDFGLQDERSDL